MTDYDTSIIRPEMRIADVKRRPLPLAGDERTRLERALRQLHSLEIMATNIYKCQISRKVCTLNTALTAAMCNEMTHMQDFQTKLYEFGIPPSRLRWRFWIVGHVIGMGSRLMGERRILRTGIWAEKKAVVHYGEFLEAVEWDDETRRMIEKDRADEVSHVERWTQFLAGADPIC